MNKIMEYVGRLRSALHGENFEIVYNDLKNDSSLKATEIREISKIFTGASGRSRNQALGYIWEHHCAVEGNKYKMQAINGRLLS